MNADVLIVGSGHAGIEAALAAARLGCRTIMLTQNLDTIGQMSCNPAVGGSAKSQIVKEIDALGGIMGVNADATGIQFRRLNRSKGPAVWATRVQCDKKAYQFRLKAVLERAENIELLQATATEILVREGRAIGVSTDLGMEITAAAVVVTAGTFLRGLLHVGERSKPGGRMADAASSLSDNLRALGFESARFKTGTPCRLNGKTVDFDSLQRQDGDEPPPRFSNRPVQRAKGDIFTLNFDDTGLFHVEQLPCWITQTTSLTAEIIRANLHRSPLYQGRIEGSGPRYCPSIEDKIVRFAERQSHHIFLEPEGRHSEEFYVNGVSTSLPFDVQLEFVCSIPGLERARIVRPGYAVEYDYFPPTQLKATLETQRIAGLFFAGQVNGSSGYEEAAGQGLVAGANAALLVQEQEPLILNKNFSYIGVLIDDLTSRGTDEPYRMFTSRADNRLQLREDNAEKRLTPLGIARGLVHKEQQETFERKMLVINQLTRFVNDTFFHLHPLSQLLRQPAFSLSHLPSHIRGVATDDIWHHVRAELIYEGYIRQHEQRSLLRHDNVVIPDGLDFSAVPGLRTETRQKLTKVRPSSMAAARRIPGLTAADLSILSIWLTNKGNGR